MNKTNAKIYLDGAVLEDMLESLASERVAGFTTNLSLMEKAGITGYVELVKKALAEITKCPTSSEVFSDNLEVVEEEAGKIPSLGDNVYVKTPVAISNGTSAALLLKRLSPKGIEPSVTAIFTVDQVREVVDSSTDNAPSIVLVFAGRIADTGVDPMLIMRELLGIYKTKEGYELLWASPREAFNIYQANELGVDIITCISTVIEKFPLIGKDLSEYSLDTMKMFCKDSRELGSSIL